MFGTVWLLRNLTLGGKLCLGDDKNAAFVVILTISRHCQQAWTMSHVSARLSVVRWFPTLSGPSQPSEI